MPFQPTGSNDAAILADSVADDGFSESAFVSTNVADHNRGAKARAGSANAVGNTPQPDIWPGVEWRGPSGGSGSGGDGTDNNNFSGGGLRAEAATAPQGDQAIESSCDRASAVSDVSFTGQQNPTQGGAKAMYSSLVGGGYLTVAAPPQQQDQQQQQQQHRAAKEFEQCPFCPRTFAPGRLEAHARACRTVFKEKRYPFDATTKRLKGTPLEFSRKDLLHQGALVNESTGGGGGNGSFSSKNNHSVLNSSFASASPARRSTSHQALVPSSPPSKHTLTKTSPERKVDYGVRPQRQMPEKSTHECPNCLDVSCRTREELVAHLRCCLISPSTVKVKPKSARAERGGVK